MNGVWAWISGVAIALFPSLGEPPAPVYNGYVEAEYTYVAASGPGRIERIGVSEGDPVAEGDVLLSLEDTAQRASLRAALAGVAQAEANLDNLSTGSRSDEIEVIRASLHQAEADQHLAQITIDRSGQLLEKGLVPPAQVDGDRARLASADALVEKLRAQLRVAELPARDAQRVAAEAALDMARAEAERAHSALADQTIRAPITGRVDRVFYEGGEVAATGAPIIALFRPEALKAIFFIPESDRAAFSAGDVLALGCDGCPAGLTARVTRLATSPQYTPPIIYSRDERARLVFRAEAILPDAGGLLPGQPITLRRPE
jgi:HlyD family secretion protein